MTSIASLRKQMDHVGGLDFVGRLSIGSFLLSVHRPFDKKSSTLMKAAQVFTRIVINKLPLTRADSTYL